MENRVVEIVNLEFFARVYMLPTHSDSCMDIALGYEFFNWRSPDQPNSSKLRQPKNIYKKTFLVFLIRIHFIFLLYGALRPLPMLEQFCSLQTV